MMKSKIYTGIDFFKLFDAEDLEVVRMDLGLLMQGYKFTFVVDTFDISEYFNLPYKVFQNIDSNSKTNNTIDFLNSSSAFLWLYEIFFNGEPFFSNKIILDEYKAELIGLYNSLLEKDAHKYLNTKIEIKDEYFDDKDDVTNLKTLSLLNKLKNKNSIVKFLLYYNQYVSIFNLSDNSFNDLGIVEVHQIFQNSKKENILPNTLLDAFITADSETIEKQVDKKKYLHNSYNDLCAVNRIVKVNNSFYERRSKNVVLYISNAKKSKYFFDNKCDMFYNKTRAIKNYFEEKEHNNSNYTYHRNSKQLLLLYIFYKHIENETLANEAIDQLLVNLIGYYEKKNLKNNLKFLEESELNKEHLNKIIAYIKLPQIESEIESVTRMFDKQDFINVEKIREEIYGFANSVNELASDFNKQKDEFKNKIAFTSSYIKSVNLLNLVNRRFRPYLKKTKDVVWNPFQNIPLLFVLKDEKQKIKTQTNDLLYLIIIECIESTEQNEQFRKIFKDILIAIPSEHTKVILLSFVRIFSIENQNDKNNINKQHQLEEDALNLLSKYYLILKGQTVLHKSDLLDVKYFLVWINRRITYYDESINLCEKVLNSSEIKNDKISTFRFLQGKALALCSKFYAELDNKIFNLSLLEESLSIFNECHLIIKSNVLNDKFDFRLLNLTLGSILNSIVDLNLRKAIYEDSFSNTLLDQLNVLVKNCEELMGDLFYKNHSFIHTKIELIYENARFGYKQYLNIENSIEKESYIGNAKKDISEAVLLKTRYPLEGLHHLFKGYSIEIDKLHNLINSER